MQELTTPFEQHDLVWAKVQHYPWWPGKIVEIFQQNHSLIFKISFYADPTYCYIKQDAIIPFQQFRQQMNANFTINAQLQKAIILANNAFQRKKSTLENKKDVFVSKQPTVIELDSIMVEQQPSKVDDFEQETIPIDFEAENSNGKIEKTKKATQIQNLLAKYKLDKIPTLPKITKIAVEQEPLEEGHEVESHSDSEENVELFDIKRGNKRRNTKKIAKRRPIIKRKTASPSTTQQRKVQFMRRACSLLISKGIEAQTSRQIIVRMVQKTQQSIEKSANYFAQKTNEQMLNVKLMCIVAELETAWTYEQKLVHIFRSIDGIMYQMGFGEKEEEEKTNIIYADEEEVSAMC